MPIETAHTMTDIELMTAAELELDEAVRCLEDIVPTSGTHAALIGDALKAVRAADDLLARVTLARAVPRRRDSHLSQYFTM